MRSPPLHYDPDSLAHDPNTRPASLEDLLDRYAPFTPAPLCPELRVFQAPSLTEVWEAADRLAGTVTPSPFWAYAWPAGAALAREILDRPEHVRGRRVLDVGCGGGVTALAAATTDAAEVVANDIDPRALETTTLAARRQGLDIVTLPGDLTRTPDVVAAFDVVLCADMAYERSPAAALAALARHARSAGARVLVADAGRKYFDAVDTELLAEHHVDVPEDLEGVERRLARVYRLR